jgi:hypothetical protein
MNRGFRRLGILAVMVFVAGLTCTPSWAGSKRTFTGEVGDSMCGRKHMEDTPAPECTRACVGHGSKYALIIGEKIYTLDTSDQASLSTLDKQAGKTATVTGTLDGDTITVDSVAAK